MKQLVLTTLFLVCYLFTGYAQETSVARQWNEVLLDAIRVDVSRPTVHARNLCHVSSAMYDAWAAYDEDAGTFFLGNQIGEYQCDFDGIDIPTDPAERAEAQEMAISYAAYRILVSRFANSPGAAVSLPKFDSLMFELGYDINNVSTDYSTNDPAALGNYIALSCLEFGLLDHSNEEMNYSFADTFYQTVNPPLMPELTGNPNIVDLNHWQALAIDGNPERKFLSPQWGYVTGFSLTADDRTWYDNNGVNYPVYLDPGSPPEIDYSGATAGWDDYYKWNHALVAVWSGHLDATDGRMIDISPASVGNLSTLPTTEEEFREFYHLIEGGVTDTGYAINPATGAPYDPQIVPMGDFGRVLAEFWADGPNSETPPGHWFTILNKVSDHPAFEKRFEGSGELLDDLEWDIKAYFAMGGAMHDVAVSVWGIKSYYDFIRPISAIRAMGDLGQSSDTSQLSYHPGGLPLIDGHIELVLPGDSLAGNMNENVGKIKLLAWRGPDYLDSDTSVAGVDWILSGDWWPYQKPSFITPPFAGYISGHSTFSRAAAEIMTLLTGDPYFPGGMGVFHAPKNEFLQFEQGPSVDIDLQWATYRDASDQASLSRLWGGIHPPIDDVPGRKIGQIIGPKAFDHAKFFFNGGFSSTEDFITNSDQPGLIQNYPNPVSDQTTFEYSIRQTSNAVIRIYDLKGQLVDQIGLGRLTPGVYMTSWSPSQTGTPNGNYAYQLESDGKRSEMKLMTIVK